MTGDKIHVTRYKIHGIKYKTGYKIQIIKYKILEMKYKTLPLVGGDKVGGSCIKH